MSKYIVLKFGGSSQCKEGLNVILNKIKEYREQSYKIILVVSAVGKTTNNLYGIADFELDKYDTIYNSHRDLCRNVNVRFECIHELLSNLCTDMRKYNNEPFCDQTQQKLKMISYGEFLSSTIVHNFLCMNGIQNKLINAHHFIKNKSSSVCIDHDTLNTKGTFYCDETVLNKLIEIGDVFITQGFIATTSDNKLCVLTRSGSNTTGALIAATVDSQRLEIWSDTNGLCTADPRKVKNAKLVPYIGYSVAQEVAAAGSQIIHPFSIVPCQKKHIPIHMKNTFNESGPSTIINGKDRTDNNVHVITCKENVNVIQIILLDMWEGYGFLSEIFKSFTTQKITIDIVSTSQFSISVTTSEKSEKKLERVINELCEKYEVNLIKNCASISVIADNISHNKTIQMCHQYVNEINSEPIYITDFACNNMSISYVVNMSYCDTLLNILHKELIEKTTV